MTPLYCSNHHENPPGSRFCHLCGEALVVPSAGSGIVPGLILGDRYRVVRELGHGGFGRTYLAEDTNRFNEPCVLKEFAPQVQGTYALQKAQELFEREAGVLYQLRHPQIPQFRELFRVDVGSRGLLFLVQDFVAGQTYHALLEERKRQGLAFTEPEVTQLLLQLLPVLEYLHQSGVIHRDISPDNLILRTSDQLPILIDFGGVKQVAAAIASQVAGTPQPPTSNPPTRLGKVGYAPSEQMQMGLVSPHSDLYALAVTALVLLTGKEPQALFDSYTYRWNWQRMVTVTPRFAGILDRMLAAMPEDRFQSAYQVQQALGGNLPPTNSAPTQPLITQPAYTPTAAETQALAATSPIYQPVQPSVPTPGPKRRSGIGTVLLVLVLMAGTGGLGWWATTHWFKKRSPTPKPTQTVEQPNNSTDANANYSTAELTRKQALRERRNGMGIENSFFVNLVNEAFYNQHPDQQGRSLSSGPEDEALRKEWDNLAAKLLDRLATISPESRSRMGYYTSDDRDRWKAEVNKRFLSSRALYDLADGVFFQLFPEYRGQTNFLNQPIGQVWQAIVADQVDAIKAGTALETIQFTPGSFTKQVSGKLKPGQGKAYIARLLKDQVLKIEIQASDQSTNLSLYPPTSKLPPLLQNSTKQNWSGKLAQSGYYEIVVTSVATEAIAYQLDIAAADNITTPGTATPTPPSTATPSPTSSPDTKN